MSILFYIIIYNVLQKKNLCANNAAIVRAPLCTLCGTKKMHNVPFERNHCAHCAGSFVHIVRHSVVAQRACTMYRSSGIIVHIVSSGAVFEKTIVHIVRFFSQKVVFFCKRLYIIAIYLVYMYYIVMIQLLYLALLYNYYINRI